MGIGDSIEKAIDEMLIGNAETAMLHACNAVSGTSRKCFPNERSSKSRFTNFLRENYLILGLMGTPGIDLEGKPLPVSIPYSTAPDVKAEFADVIYGIHCFCQGDGEGLSQGFELIPDVAGPPRITCIAVRHGKTQMSDRVVFGLLAACVVSPSNVDETTSDGYFLTLGSEHAFLIKEWWGRRTEFELIARSLQLPYMLDLEIG